MKIIAKLLFFLLIFFIAASAVTNCTVEPVPSGENPYSGNKLIIDNQQVWTRNRQAKKISQAYLKYGGNHGITVFVFVAENDLFNNENALAKPVGSGSITNGILNIDQFSLKENEHLLDWKRAGNDHFRSFFSNYWHDTDINDSTVKGNMILLEALTGNVPFGLLDRQRIYGTETSITCEVVLYIYVNKDCTITGNASEGYIQGQYYYYTDGNLNLKLKKGINMVCRKETYTTDFSGSAVISMEIREPIQNPENFKWVIEPDFIY